MTKAFSPNAYLPSTFSFLYIYGLLLLPLSALPNTNPHIITIVCCLPLLHCGFNGSPQYNTWTAIQRGWPRALWQGSVLFDKIMV